MLSVVTAFVGFGLLCTSAFALNTRPIDGDYQIQDEMIFRKDEVTVCRITLDPVDFQAMLDDPDSNEKRRATVRWQNSMVDQTLENVGIRPRGNLSRSAPRKSWKLDFNEFVPGRSLFGLEEIDLNGDNNDPTLLRRMLVHEFLQRLQLPVSRTHYVAIYVNGDFRSLNIHVEAIDEDYAEHWFGNKQGNLYKCLFKGERADLSFRPQNDYQTLGGGETYRETNNDPNSDYADISGFIDFFNNSPDQTVFENLHEHLNVDGFLRYLAANVVLGNWDDYWYGSNNFYMYRNQETDSFEWIPFDYDNSLGVDFFGTDWSNRFFNTWGDGGFGSTPAPLVDRVFDHSNWRRQFRRYLMEGMDILDDPGFQGLASDYHNLILPWFDGTIESGGIVGTITSSDQHTPYFTTFNEPADYAGFLNAHRHGIVPYMEDRVASLNAQLAGFTTPPLARVFVNEVVAANASVGADNFGEFEDWIELYNAEPITVDLSGWLLTDNPSDPDRYEFPAGTTIPSGGYLVVYADGQTEQQTSTALHAPFRLASSGETVALFTPAVEGAVLVDFLPATLLTTNRSLGRLPDGSDNVTILPCPTPEAMNSDSTDCNPIEPRVPPRLLINEFMADNDSVIADNFGEFDDWFEIYNAELTAVDLGGLHVTDDLAQPGKWEIPEGTTIDAKGFLLIWADNDEAQNIDGVLHADFNLSRNGESLGIFDNDENLNQPIHVFTYGAQETDVSEGLLPDGEEDNRGTLEIPTPGSTNTPMTIIMNVWALH